MWLNIKVGVFLLCCVYVVTFNIIAFAERSALDISPSFEEPPPHAKQIMIAPDQCIMGFSNSTTSENSVISLVQKQKICPSSLPQFDRPRKKRPTRPIQLCVIGSTEDFASIKQFLRSNKDILPTWIQFHSFGSPGPRTMVAYWTAHAANYSLIDIYDECDGMLGLTVDDSSLPAGLVHAVAYDRPILLALSDAQTYKSDLLATKVFSDETFESSLKMLIEHFQSDFFTRKPDCEVLIDNHLIDFHYFLLESFMALYPLPELESCNHNYLQFTFLINRALPKFQHDRADSWKEYAVTAMRDKYKTDRFVKSVIWGGAVSPTRAMKFDYEIKASCYCQERDLTWLQNSSKAYCVFHESCDEYAESPQALWLSPHHKQHVLPTLLPEFKHPRPVNQTVNFCTIGHPGRRNYGLVAHFLKSRKPQGIHFHNLGWGPRPKEMDDFQHLFSRYTEPHFIHFQQMVYDLCDIVLALITRETQPDYFSGPKKKQSGSILHAIAYQRPMVLHEDLAEPYKAQLPHIETHTDDVESFAAAMDRMLAMQRKEKEVTVHGT